MGVGPNEIAKHAEKGGEEAPKPTVQPGPAPTDPATGKPLPPPIPAPVDVNGKPTNWKPIPGSGPIPGNRWVPDGKVPSPDGKSGTPAVVWDPHDGYWTHDDGGGNRTHWGTNGVQVAKQVTFWGTVAAIGYQIIQAAGGPPFTIFACAVPTEGAPSLRFFGKGGTRCCVCYLILLWTRDQNHLARAFPTPAPSQKTRRNGAPTVLVMPVRSKAGPPALEVARR